ncbi:MAG: hypothetical protein JNM84_12120 [Planctomycetes bacterium]|nr:hypothetical protein [Planctomycetota bacterium]
MRIDPPTFLALLAVSGAVSPTSLLAQSAKIADFAPPVRLMSAGAKFLGEQRLYPAPTYHDVDGDGLQDIVVGDLRGLLTVARRLPGAGPARYAEEQPVRGTDGEEIDFHNW